MNEIETKRTPALIGAEIRMYVDAGRRVTLLCGIEIGRRLVEAKELLSHGEWLPWLKAETDFSERSAQRYMQVFEEYGAAQLGLFGPETNTPTLSGLPISKALALLSVPESERESFAAEVGASDLSTRELEAAIAARKEAEARADAAEKRATDAERALHEAEEGEGLAIADLQEKLDAAEFAARKAEAEAKRATEDARPYIERAEQAENAVAALREQVRELEARPVATVTVPDQAAIDTAATLARAKAESEAAETINALQKQIAKAEKEAAAALKAAKKEAEAAKAEAKRAEDAAAPYKAKAEEAEKAAEAARQELEEAKKKLKTSSADVTKFGVHFKAMQESFNRCVELLPEIGERDAEVAAKLRGGMQVLVGKMLERVGGERDEDQKNCESVQEAEDHRAV